MMLILDGLHTKDTKAAVDTYAEISFFYHFSRFMQLRT